MLEKAKKIFSNHPYGSKRLEAIMVGTYRDDKGVLWDVWRPTGLTMSVWYRLECKGMRTRFVYDAGRSFSHKCETFSPDWR